MSKHREEALDCVRNAFNLMPVPRGNSHEEALLEASLAQAHALVYVGDQLTKLAEYVRGAKPR